jgi:hypothetical protein
MLWDSLLSLREAWHWVQIGFCAAVGAAVVLLPKSQRRPFAMPSVSDRIAPAWMARKS